MIKQLPFLKLLIHTLSNMRLGNQLQKDQKLEEWAINFNKDKELILLQ